MQIIFLGVANAPIGLWSAAYSMLLLWCETVIMWWWGCLHMKGSSSWGLLEVIGGCVGWDWRELMKELLPEELHYRKHVLVVKQAWVTLACQPAIKLAKHFNIVVEGGDKHSFCVRSWRTMLNTLLISIATSSVWEGGFGLWNQLRICCKSSMCSLLYLMFVFLCLTVKFGKILSSCMWDWWEIISETQLFVSTRQGVCNYLL